MPSPLQDILEERTRQDAKWGEQNHCPERWLVILGEEYGEACSGVLHGIFGPDWDLYRAELIHVAAVALAALESFDRGKWR